MFLIKKVSEISGVSVRTLHHYDEIGLLSPKKSENGYRYYSEDDMSFLQMILFYKYLGFPLKQIKDLLKQEDPEILHHLKKQLVLMQKEKQKLLTLIDTLEKTIESRERKITMSIKEKFRGFVYQDNQKYEEMAIDKYGKDIIEKSMENLKGKEVEFTENLNQIFTSFAENMAKGIEATSKESVELAKSLHEYICRYSFDCSMEAFSGIGYGYQENPEFKSNIDRFGIGTAEYACDSIQKYVSEAR